MHVISRSRLAAFWSAHPDAESSLRAWYQVASKARFEHLADLRRTFPSADKVGERVVFDVGGNRFRLIAFVDYGYQKTFVRHVLTHKEYDGEACKNDPWF